MGAGSGLRNRDDGPIVSTDAGQVRGRVVSDGVLEFLAVPYAAPPVGRRRLQAPEAPEAWSGVRDATTVGTTAPQPPPMPIGVAEPIVPGDDYLHVNVTAPAGADGAPVLVWIHGGGAVQGSNSSPLCAARRFARDGIVTVSANYRLGAEGFLALEGAPANRGVLDWIAALEWVQRNVANFGGDPRRVTIAGHSAGSAAVLILAGLPEAGRLFRQVIAMSGVPSGLPAEDEAVAFADEFCRALDVDRSVDGFASAPMDRMLEVQASLSPILHLTGGPREVFMRTLHPGARCGPVVDGAVIPIDPVEALAAGTGADVRLLIGYTAEEMDLLIAGTGGSVDEDLVRSVFDELRVPAEAAADYLRAHSDLLPSILLGRAATDLTFKVPACRVAERRLSGHPPTYLYEFGWKPQSGFGAIHGIDIPFLFDTVDTEGISLLLGDTVPRDLVDAYHAAFAQFVTTGSPGWDAYEHPSRYTMTFGRTTELQSDPQRVPLNAFSHLR